MTLQTKFQMENDFMSSEYEEYLRVGNVCYYLCEVNKDEEAIYKRCSK